MNLSQRDVRSGSNDLQTFLDGRLRRSLERQTRRRSPRLPAPQVLVEAPGVRFSHGDIDQPFHTASAGKNFLAVLIARFIERGDLSIDSPLGDALPTADLAQLLAADGVDVAREVTIEDLLSHRSGLPDPFLPPRGHRTACSLKALAADPTTTWTPRSVLAETSDLPPRGRPGARFHYSDAGYALLTLVAEEVGGAPLGEVLHTGLFAPARMPHTHLLDPSSPDPRLAAMWLGGTEVSGAPALSIGSIDGGAVTTAADLVAFQRALHGGQLISPELLAELVRPRSRMRPGIHYGAGFVTLRFGGFMPVVLRGLPEPVGGLGLSAVHAFYYAEQDAHVVLNFHDTRAMSASFQTHIAIARALARTMSR
ncbi:serine hydrolase domain-containing protein [Ornithinimicrobium sp. Y1847]|uniref:serine hydrolase domain-containing protein n=1 Tax=Ornithinimicrobium sp. Y1847 TaxID=3405419 RepID=UPI003B66FDD9